MATNLKTMNATKLLLPGVIGFFTLALSSCSPSGSCEQFECKNGGTKIADDKQMALGCCECPGGYTGNLCGNKIGTVFMAGKWTPANSGNSNSLFLPNGKFLLGVPELGKDNPKHPTQVLVRRLMINGEHVDVLCTLHKTSDQTFFSNDVNGGNLWKDEYCPSFTINGSGTANGKQYTVTGSVQTPYSEVKAYYENKPVKNLRIQLSIAVEGNTVYSHNGVCKRVQ